MFRINRLKISKFRNVDETELEFGPGAVLLLGKNGTGKTTLLNLLAEIVAGLILHSPDGAEAEFSGHVTMTNGPEFEFEYFQPSSLPPSTNEARRHPIATIRGPHGAQSEEGPFLWRPELLEPTVGEDAARKMRAAPMKVLDIRSAGAEATTYVGRLDEALDSYRRMSLGDAAEVGATVMLDMSGAPVFLVAPPHLPTKLLIEAARTNEAEVSWTHESAGSALADLPRMLGVDSITARMTRLEVKRTGDLMQHVFTAPAFEFRLQDGTSFPHGRLSFGQKRLLAFAHYVQALDGRPALCDELSNGFHYDWIAYALDKLQGQQSFLSSQNPVLLDRMSGLEDVKAVRRSFVTCRIDERKSGRRLRWANATQEEAEDFLRGYQTGIAHVSEVLRDKELW